MANSNTYKNKIDAYVHGRMNSEDRQSFEREMAQDPDLQKEVQLVLQLKRNYADRNIYEFKKRIDGLKSGSEEKLDSEKISTGAIPLWIKIVSVAAMLAVVFGLWNIVDYEEKTTPFKTEITSKLESEDLRDPIIEDLIINTRSSGSQRTDLTTSDSLFIDLHEWFNQLTAKEVRELNGFIQHTEQLLMKQQFPDRYKESARVLLSRAYLLQSKPKKARRALHSIDSNSPIYCHARYYRAISLSAIGRNKEAKQVLDAFECKSFAKPFRELENKITERNSP